SGPSGGTRGWLSHSSPCLRLNLNSGFIPPEFKFGSPPREGACACERLRRAVNSGRRRELPPVSRATSRNAGWCALPLRPAQARLGASRGRCDLPRVAGRLPARLQTRASSSRGLPSTPRAVDLPRRSGEADVSRVNLRSEERPEPAAQTA